MTSLDEAIKCTAQKSAELRFSNYMSGSTLAKGYHLAHHAELLSHVFDAGSTLARLTCLEESIFNKFKETQKCTHSIA